MNSGRINLPMQDAICWPIAYNANSPQAPARLVSVRLQRHPFANKQRICNATQPQITHNFGLFGPFDDDIFEHGDGGIRRLANAHV